MNDEQQRVRDICARFGHDPTRLLDIALAVQGECRSVSDDAIDTIAAAVGLPRVDVESVATFYAFLGKEPRGRVVIRLCNDVVDRMAGADRVVTAFCDELGIGVGETTSDGTFSLEQAPCIGMSDQAPAALVNEVVITELTTDAARDVIRRLRKDPDPKALVRRVGDGNNGHELVRAMVKNNIRRAGPVIFGPSVAGEALAKALAMSPQEVIRAVKTARLRGRGGAGFPTGMKWEYTRTAPGDQRYVVCNADEGEPGTFKDRVILTERPDLMLEGMTIAGYAIGATAGIIYLRGEYAYLRPFLEQSIADRRSAGLLGVDILGKKGCSFDVSIQMGAGAYVCGEETALLSSCEGLRGDPKTRPPYPAQKGYLGSPTTVNNVETLCCVARIFERGVAWFAQLGTRDSAGTKLLSVSGDCTSAGVFEYPFGVTLTEVLEDAGAYRPGAVQVGGPSGQLVAPDQFAKPIAYEGLSTGGAIVVFRETRNPVEIAREYLRFFEHESCGYCTPCRVGCTLMRQRLDRILVGHGEPDDLRYLRELGATMRTASRCGLGQTAANPVLSSLTSFPSSYEDMVTAGHEGLRPTFDIHAALADAVAIAGRGSRLFRGGGAHE